jgi:hypothetical protein
VPAFYCNWVSEFLSDSTELIVGRLTSVTNQGLAELSAIQLDAWRRQIAVLKAAVVDPAEAQWGILLEYPIPRRGKRIDCILLAGDIILVLEFKCGGKAFERNAITQVEDYCLDLRDFHKASESRAIVPVVVATEAPSVGIPQETSTDRVQPIWLANAADLSEKLLAAYHRYATPQAIAIEIDSWDRSEYYPTPTIIESARALYAGQNVREISRCQAGATNLTATSDAVITAIENARTRRESSSVS